MTVKRFRWCHDHTICFILSWKWHIFLIALNWRKRGFLHGANSSLIIQTFVSIFTTIICSRSRITHFTPLSFSARVSTYSQSRGRKTVRVRFRGPLPQVAGGIVILLNIWFGFAQAAVTSLHQSHESHPVNLGQAADWSWYTSEAWRIPPTAEGYDVGRGNKWWWYQRKSAFCLPGLQATTALFFLFFTNMMMRNTDVHHDSKLTWPWNQKES